MCEFKEILNTSKDPQMWRKPDKIVFLNVQPIKVFFRYIFLKISIIHE